MKDLEGGRSDDNVEGEVMVRRKRIYWVIGKGLDLIIMNDGREGGGGMGEMRGKGGGLLLLRRWKILGDGV